MKRLLKFLHTVAAIGLTGGLACYVVLLATAPEAPSLEAYAALRAGIAAVCKWLVLPSLVVVLTSGLLAIAAHPPYREARWAWLKAALGLAMFEGTLGGVQGPAERGAVVAAQAAAGEIDPQAVAGLIGDEWNALRLILLLAIANVAIAVWRPRLKRRADPAASPIAGA